MHLKGCWRPPIILIVTSICKMLCSKIYSIFSVFLFVISHTFIFKTYVIGEQKNESNFCSSKESSRAIRAVWTKNHPRRDSVHGQ